MKFKVIDNLTGLPIKPDHGKMIVMNTDGQLFLVTGMGDWETGIVRFSHYYSNYSVQIATLKENGKWIYK